MHRVYFVADSRLERLLEFTYRSLRPRLGDEWLILDAPALAAVIGAGARGSGGLEELARRQAPWTLVYGVSGYKYLPEERAAAQERELSLLAQACGVRPAPEVPGCPSRMMEKILAAPSPEPYYRTARRGAFREVFFLATLDMVPRLLGVMEECCSGHGFSMDELGTYIQPIQQGRTAHVEFTVCYDPADGAESKRASELVENAAGRLDAAGAFFSRPYGPWAEVAYRGCPDSVEALWKVKRMMDPDNVLNRGKLCFAREVV